MKKRRNVKLAKRAGSLLSCLVWCCIVISLVSAMLLLLAIAIPVLAQTFYSTITVVPSLSSSMADVRVSVNNTYLATHGYMNSSGNDTRVLSAGAEIPWLVADNTTWFASPLVSGVSQSYEYTFGNSPASSFFIVTGYGGNVTADNATNLDLGNRFAVEVSGWLDTDNWTDRNILYKMDSFRLHVSGSGNMTAITIATDTTGIGSAATNRASHVNATATYIDLANPATLSGNITDIKVWATTDLTGFRVGTFRLLAGVTYQCRDSETIGAVTSGSQQSFTGLNIEVRPGDFIGVYFNTGTLESGAGGTNLYYFVGEAIDPGDSANYTLIAGNAMSLQGSKVVIFAAAVTATGVTTGEQKIRVTGDGDDLKIWQWVSGAWSEKDTAPIGVGAFPSSSPWWFFQNNVMPYVEYIKIWQ